MNECRSHHLACECREQQFAKVEQELFLLKQFIFDMRAQATLISTLQGYFVVVPEQFMRERI